MTVAAHRRLAAVGYAALAVAAVALAIVATLLFWPYNSFSYGATGPLKVTERTSDGIPVIRVGEAVVWDQEFCNRGVVLHNDRWADIYGTGVEAGFARTDTDADDRVASFEVPSIVFYAHQDLCDTTEVFAILPDYVAANTYYRFRVESYYEPNPLRRITATQQTELFLLLPVGAPIP